MSLLLQSGLLPGGHGGCRSPVGGGSLGWVCRGALGTIVVLPTIPIPRVSQRFPVCSTALGQGDPIQSLSEDLDHGAFIMDITQAAESDHLAQELWSKLETSDSPWGWEWSEGQLQFQGCLYVPNQEILHLQVICNHHNPLVAGHFREARTSKLIRHSFHWPGLRQMVKDYMASCTTCACTKSVRHKPYRKLKQLPIPSQPWLSILMDFIEQLPASEDFSTILVVVNWLMKQVIFIPSHDTMNALQVAQLFLTHIFSKHGVPSHVTLD